MEPGQGRGRGVQQKLLRGLSGLKQGQLQDGGKVWKERQQGEE